jgi:hypothetical protein
MEKVTGKAPGDTWEIIRANEAPLPTAIRRCGNGAGTTWLVRLVSAANVNDQVNGDNSVAHCISALQ